jgi:hypothetical protein
LYADNLFLGRVGRDGYAFILQNCQIRLVEEDGLKSTGIVRLVALNPVGTDGRSATCVEHPVLETGEIRIDGHFAAKGVEFENEMGLGQSAD